MASEFKIIGEFEDKDIQKAFKKIEKKLNETGKRVKQSSAGFKKLGTVIASAFAVTAIINFGKRVAQTRGEFQKLQVVLENTLGSKSKAQNNFKVLNQLAKTSNFGLLELTDSYVKLVNQGITPTRLEMIKLSDLANSTGKTFNQLTEAIIDAQVGENERLKEFGIRAQKNGEKTIFTFKGVKTEVDNTTESIKNYLIGLGNLEGVTGATEKISATLGGKISNLGDAFDNFLNKVGTESQPVFNTLLDLAIEALGILPNVINKLIEWGKAGFDALQEINKEFGTGLGFLGAWNFALNSLIAVFVSFFDIVVGGFHAISSAMSFNFNASVIAIEATMDNLADNFTKNFDKMGALYKAIMGDMKKETKNFSKDFQNRIQSNTTEVKASQRDIRAESKATALSRSRDISDFRNIAVSQIADVVIANLISKIIASLPFPINIAVAGGAGAMVRGLFGQVAGSFADGGVIGGNSFAGDNMVAMVNSGERVLNIPQQEFLLKAAGDTNANLEIIIAQNEQMLDHTIFGSSVDNTQASVAFIDAFDLGTKNKELLASSR